MTFSDDRAIDALLHPEPVELSGDGDGRGGPRPYGPSRARRAMALAVAALFLGAVVGLAVVSDSSSAFADIRDVRRFVKEQRSASFTGSTSSRTHYEDSAPDDEDDVDEASQVEGQIRLPNEGRVLSVEDGWASETIVQGHEVFERSAESRSDLDGERWTSSRQGPLPEGIDEMLAMMARRPGGLPVDPSHPEVVSGLRLAHAFDLGIPLYLDDVLSRMRGARQVQDGRLVSAMSLGDFFGDEFMRLAEYMTGEVEQEWGSAHSDDEPVRPTTTSTTTPPGASGRRFDGTVTVTVDHGPDGRLDALHFRLVADVRGERSVDEHFFRFADWGKPVTLTLPDKRNVDSTENIDEEALAAVQGRLTVLAPAPSALPSEWLLQSVEVVNDEDSDDCDSVEVQFAPDFNAYSSGTGYAPTPPEVEDDGFGGSSAQIQVEVVPPPPTMLLVESKPVACAGRGSQHDLAQAGTPIQIGQWKGYVMSGGSGGSGGSGEPRFVQIGLDVGGTRVTAHTTADQATLVAALQTLQPFRVEDYRVGRGSPWGAVSVDD